MRLNFTQTILNDSGIWTCEIVVRSDRHVINKEGRLILGGQVVIGTPLRHQFLLTVIGELIYSYKILELYEHILGTCLATWNMMSTTLPTPTRPVTGKSVLPKIGPGDHFYR